MKSVGVIRRHDQPNWFSLAWLGAYSASMGVLEAICVIYLRRLPAAVRVTLTIPRLPLSLEVVREACTLVMLAAVAWLTAGGKRSAVACFFYAFGIWDIFYYVGLRVFTGWPATILTWDCLFLIPRPWYSPVLAPLLVSAYFIAAGGILFVLSARRPSTISVEPIFMHFAALVLLYRSFTEHTDQIAHQGYGTLSYSWHLLIIAIILSVAGLALRLREHPRIRIKCEPTGRSKRKE